MQRHAILDWLVPIIVVLAVINAGVGLFTFTTVHGRTVEMYGRGVYQNDSLLVGAGFRGTDVVTLLIAVLLLAASIMILCTLSGELLEFSADSALSAVQHVSDYYKSR